MNRSTTTASPELVVLLDDAGSPIGAQPKRDVHHANTPLHLAFSCYVLDERGFLLVTRRALSKQTWPGVWTNSFCGHPAPNESFVTAISRRAARELGIAVTDISCELPNFAYRAVDASGIIENEICPVFSARLIGTITPAADEVSEWRWIHPQALHEAAAAAPFAFSPWLVEQLPQLLALGSLTASETK